MFKTNDYGSHGAFVMINKRLHFKSPFLSIQILDQITGLLNGWLNYLLKRDVEIRTNVQVTNYENGIMTLNTVVEINK